MRSPSYPTLSTMSKTSHGISRDPGKSDANPAGHDDMSDVTVNNGKASNENYQQMISKVLKFSFVYSGTTQHKIAPSIVHTHWMQAVQAAFGPDVIIMNNLNKQVENIDPLKWTDQSIHQKQFTMYQKSTGRDAGRITTYYILHRILTNETISKIKSTPSVYKITKDYQCYVTDHQWDETVMILVPERTVPSQAQYQHNVSAEITIRTQSRLKSPVAFNTRAPGNTTVEWTKRNHNSRTFIYHKALTP